MVRVPLESTDLEQTGNNPKQFAHWKPDSKHKETNAKIAHGPSVIRNGVNRFRKESSANSAAGWNLRLTPRGVQSPGFHLVDPRTASFEGFQGTKGGPEGIAGIQPAT